jgi:hypothetical protein
MRPPDRTRSSIAVRSVFADTGRDPAATSARDLGRRSTDANEPPAKGTEKRCAASNDAYQTPATANSYAIPHH